MINIGNPLLKISSLKSLLMIFFLGLIHLGVFHFHTPQKIFKGHSFGNLPQWNLAIDYALVGEEVEPDDNHGPSLFYFFDHLKNHPLIFASYKFAPLTSLKTTSAQRQKFVPYLLVIPPPFEV